MTFVETTFKIDSKSKVASFLSWKRFKDDKEFLSNLEDLFFGQIIKDSDKWNYTSKDNIFDVLEKNIWK